MYRNKKYIQIALIILVIILVIPMVITYAIHDHYFGKRVVHSNNYYEYISSENTGFSREKVSFESDKGQKIEGAFYFDETLEEPNSIIIWVHGMGVNYDNYLGEIEFLTNQGYIVFSYNNTGVDLSEGDSLVGLIQAPIDLQHALIYLHQLEIFNEIPNILIGHSWGGFSVATVSQLDIPRPVDGIITLAGFWKNTNIIEDIAKYYVGDIVEILMPYLSAYESFIFKENSKINGLDGLKNTDCPVLMIHSEDDVIVQSKSNFDVYKSEFENNERFTFKLYENAGHKLTINKESYERIHDIMHHQMALNAEDEHYIELDQERLSLIRDFNTQVMTDITEFIGNIISNYH